MPRSKNHTRRVARSRPRGIMQLNPEGYGFVRTSEGEFFVPHAKLGGAFDGDLVEVAPLPANASKGRSHEGFGGGRYAHKPAARVVSVVERAHEVVVGRFEAAEPFGVVMPLDPHIPYDIFTQLSEAPDVEDGAIVRVRIAQFPSRNSAATGHIEEVLEHVDRLDEGVDAVVARHKFETTFSDAALAEAHGASIDEVGALASGYRDLRERFIFTIDPDDARDFDDALSIEQVEDQGRLLWRIGVHIADVSHYVEWGSALDLAARRRATSVYLVDRAIPMIPEDLSCGLCSLAPGEVRRSMTVELYVDERAQLARYEIYPALIRSNARLTYGEALEMLEGKGEDEVAAGQGVGHTPCSDSPARANSPLGCLARAELRAEHAPRPQGPRGSRCDNASEFEPAVIPENAGRAPRAVPQRSEDCLSTEYAPHSQGQRETSLRKRLLQLSRLASLRHAQRERKGGIDFDQPEARVMLDEAGRPQGVELRRKNAATSLVEEMMIWANEVVAEHLSRAKFPCVYRVHEAPDLEGLAQLVPIFEEFPWFGKIDPVGFFMGSQHALQQAVSASRGRAEGELVSSLVLRSMKRAAYREKNCGHYGLASATYCHFTSPIRRYPDLMVHRMLKAELFGRPERFDQMTTNLGWICEHSSGMEREADDAQRESEELKLAEYLQRFVGQSFSAIVSGVSQGGLYARLENTAEGFIPVRTLGDDYFSFDAARYALTGEETGARYRLGQRIAVVLFAVDSRVPQIDLRLAQGSKR
ncbi:ribonuclease R family protein [Ellagibacter isourolithinifaciens]|uniref:ribonuclease R family protein n=1 Tax=Ellagibacter isourolithinifaciens TaxID=2137581 RepID=UPI002E77781F|nr:RNB domain-containing ribonuclease [Ellagibacter isourolithinifaciens]MEE0245736.1 RNB domain-containing ribonuclease [Ellagibacter isourolithinifaciens]